LVSGEYGASISASENGLLSVSGKTKKDSAINTTYLNYGALLQYCYTIVNKMGYESSPSAVVSYFGGQFLWGVNGSQEAGDGSQGDGDAIYLSTVQLEFGGFGSERLGDIDYVRIYRRHAYYQESEEGFSPFYLVKDRVYVGENAVGVIDGTPENEVGLEEKGYNIVGEDVVWLDNRLFISDGYIAPLQGAGGRGREAGELVCVIELDNTGGLGYINKVIPLSLEALEAEGKWFVASDVFYYKYIDVDGRTEVKRTYCDVGYIGLHIHYIYPNSIHRIYVVRCDEVVPTENNFDDFNKSLMVRDRWCSQVSDVDELDGNAGKVSRVRSTHNYGNLIPNIMVEIMSGFSRFSYPRISIQSPISFRANKWNDIKDSDSGYMVMCVNTDMLPDSNNWTWNRCNADESYDLYEKNLSNFILRFNRGTSRRAFYFAINRYVSVNDNGDRLRFITLFPSGQYTADDDRFQYNNIDNERWDCYRITNGSINTYAVNQLISYKENMTTSGNDKLMVVVSWDREKRQTDSKINISIKIWKFAVKYGISQLELMLGIFSFSVPYASLDSLTNIKYIMPIGAMGAVYVDGQHLDLQMLDDPRSLYNYFEIRDPLAQIGCYDGEVNKRVRVEKAIDHIRKGEGLLYYSNSDGSFNAMNYFNTRSDIQKIVTMPRVMADNQYNSLLVFYKDRIDTLLVDVASDGVMLNKNFVGNVYNQYIRYPEMCEIVGGELYFVSAEGLMRFGGRGMECLSRGVIRNEELVMRNGEAGFVQYVPDKMQVWYYFNKDCCIVYDLGRECFYKFKFEKELVKGFYVNGRNVFFTGDNEMCRYPGSEYVGDGRLVTKQYINRNKLKKIKTGGRLQVTGDSSDDGEETINVETESGFGSYFDWIIVRRKTYEGGEKIEPFDYSDSGVYVFGSGFKGDYEVEFFGLRRLDFVEIYNR